MKRIKLRFKFHWNLLPGIQLILYQYSSVNICDNWGRCVKDVARWDDLRLRLISMIHNCMKCALAFNHNVNELFWTIETRNHNCIVNDDSNFCHIGFLSIINVNPKWRSLLKFDHSPSSCICPEDFLILLFFKYWSYWHSSKPLYKPSLLIGLTGSDCSEITIEIQ